MAAPAFRFIGDHSAYHCGCQAVTGFVLAELNSAGRIVESTEECDVLVVNGEGSMHDDSPACEGKMKEIEQALALGKRVWLVNTVWEANSGRWDATLGRIEQIGVREVMSQRELRFRHGIESQRFLDFSYFLAIDETAPVVDFGGKPVTTDFWSKEFRTFARLNGGVFGRHPYIWMNNYSWSSLVRSLRTSPLLITGRHHAVYAACRARTPFVAMEGNTHKIDGLLAKAPVKIPVCRNLRELRRGVLWAEKNPQAYADLFDWMESLPRWSAKASLERGSGGESLDAGFGERLAWLTRKLPRLSPRY